MESKALFQKLQGKKKLPDRRFQNNRFKDAVRKCLESLGEVSNYSNFKKWDGLIDWYSFARELRLDPEFVIDCHLYDGRGHRVCKEGEPVIVTEVVRAKSKEEAKSKLDKCYEFLRFCFN